MLKTISIKHTITDFVGVLLFYGISILLTFLTGKEGLLRNMGILLFAILLKGVEKMPANTDYHLL
jgi:hypothetical protein